MEGGHHPTPLPYLLLVAVPPLPLLIAGGGALSLLIARAFA